MLITKKGAALKATTITHILLRPVNNILGLVCLFRPLRNIKITLQQSIHKLRCILKAFLYTTKLPLLLVKMVSKATKTS